MAPENVRRLDELRTVNVLIHLLEDEDEEVRDPGSWAPFQKTTLLRKSAGGERFPLLEITFFISYLSDKIEFVFYVGHLALWILGIVIARLLSGLGPLVRT